MPMYLKCPISDCYYCRKPLFCCHKICISLYVSLRTGPHQPVNAVGLQLWHIYHLPQEKKDAFLRLVWCKLF